MSTSPATSCNANQDTTSPRRSIAEKETKLDRVVLRRALTKRHNTRAATSNIARLSHSPDGPKRYAKGDASPIPKWKGCIAQAATCNNVDADHEPEQHGA